MAMRDLIKIEDIVIPNPKISISKGAVVDYIPMEEISPNNRYVFSKQKRKYNGGAKFENEDIIFARITPCLQNRKISQYISDSKNPASGSTEYFVFRSIPNVSDNAYIYYLLKSDLVVETAINSMKGASGRQRAEIKPILDLQMNIPKYSEQVAIGKFLSAYDNLIENNNRRIAILEEMAQRLYREWFVHFRFPGHESVNMVESELGSIPENWSIANFYEIADILGGGTPSKVKPEYWINGDIPLFSPRDAFGQIYIQDTEMHISKLGLEKCNSKLYPADTVIITARGTVGKIALLSIDMAINQSCYALIGKHVGQRFLYYHLKNAINQIKKIANGTAFDTIITDTFRSIICLLPTDDITGLFENKAKTLFDNILSLQMKNTNLRKTRDLLLPPLISGNIDVSDLPIPTEED